MAESWFQRSWRPFNGYVVGVASLLTAAGAIRLAGVALAHRDLAALTALAPLVYAVASVLAIPGASVGIAAWHRGMTQRIEASQAGPPPPSARGGP